MGRKEKTQDVGDAMYDNRNRYPFRNMRADMEASKPIVLHPKSIYKGCTIGAMQLKQENEMGGVHIEYCPAWTGIKDGLLGMYDFISYMNVSYGKYEHSHYAPDAIHEVWVCSSSLRFPKYDLVAETTKQLIDYHILLKSLERLAGRALSDPPPFLLSQSEGWAVQ